MERVTCVRERKRERKAIFTCIPCYQQETVSSARVSGFMVESSDSKEDDELAQHARQTRL